MSSALRFYGTERLALFIDGPHLTAAARALEIDIDFRRLLDLFRQNGRLVRAYYYSVTADGSDDSGMHKFLDWLSCNGFAVVVAPAQPFRDASGARVYRGKSYVSFCLGVMQTAGMFDDLVLFTGDGNYCYLVQYIQQMGKRVTVVSTLRVAPVMVADKLRRQADQFVELAQLGPLICR